MKKSTQQPTTKNTEKAMEQSTEKSADITPILGFFKNILINRFLHTLRPLLYGLAERSKKQTLVILNLSF